jgi:hypothetical protein
MKCPGQDTRYWKPGDIFEVDCPHCGNKIEFFKDEATRKCRNCLQKVVNPRMDFGCATYCKYAADCLGDLAPELLAKREDLLRDRVALETKRRLGQDFGRIAHTVKVARYAEQIIQDEKAELALVLAASYLHALEEDVSQPSGVSHTAARQVLEQLGAGPEMVERVVDLIERLKSEDPGDTVSAKVFLDAHLLAETEARVEKSTERPDRDEMKSRCFTETGKLLMASLLDMK